MKPVPPLVIITGLLANGATIAAGSNTPVVLGVPRSKQASYLALYAKGKFACQNGPKTVIGFDRVNDDFCDCEDGTDEPATSACAHGRFYCKNKGHVGAYLPSSRVGDGICDCCDGSDEAPGLCREYCTEFAAETRAQRAEQIRLFEQGAAKKKTYIDEGEKAVEARAKELLSLTTDKASYEKKLETAKAKKEKEEAEEQAQKEKVLKERVEKLRSGLNIEKLSPQEVRDLYDLLKDRHGKVVKTVVEEIKVKSGIAKEEEEEEKKKKDEEGAADAAAKEEESIEDYGDDDEEEKDSEEGDEEEAAAAAAEEEEEEEADVVDPVLVSLLAEVEEGVDVKSEQANQARAEVKELQDKVNDLQKGIKEIEQTNEMDFGPLQELYPLKGKCFLKHINQYEYEMCPYGQAKQKEGGNSGVSLGKWKRLERREGEGGNGKGPAFTFYFEGGQSCWNGPARSLTITVRCGMADKVISVDEPSMCEYVMEFLTPAACTAMPDQLKLDLVDEDQKEEEEGPRSEL